MTDLDLVRMQHEWALDERGRVVGLYGFVVARARDGEARWIGADLPDALASALTTAIEPSRRLVEAAAGGALPLREGPSFVFDDDTGAAVSSARLVRSDAPGVDELRALNPGNWQPLEWDELLDGRLGPWAMALDGARVVSICHTPHAMTARAAECGVWTHPHFRGRGHAAAVTAAWAALLRPTGRRLFYSTESDNRSSQRVAERLRLRRFGVIHRVGRARDDAERGVHPLSALRRR